MYRPDDTDPNTAESVRDHKITPQQPQSRKRSRSSRSSADETFQVNNASNQHTFSSQHPSMETLSTADATDGAPPQSTDNPDEVLGPYDIICGRNKLAFNNIGNRRFRVTIQLSMDRYMAATTRNDTSKVIKYVANIVRENGGRFLRLSPDGKRWIELDNKHVHEKVGHALRDAAPTKRESNSTTNDNFPYTRPASHHAILQLQDDSANILNIPLNEHAMHRRAVDTSVLSENRQLHTDQASEQWITTTLLPDTAMRIGPTTERAALQSHESQDEDSKPPAQPHHPQVSQTHTMPPSPLRPLLPQEELPKAIAEPCIPDTCGTCSIDRDHETFDHSSLGDHHDALLDWQSDETVLE